MHKVEDIKVGDRITWGSHVVSHEVEKIIEDDVWLVKGSSKGCQDGRDWASSLTYIKNSELSNLLIIKHASQISPIKTVTRKEIVPGEYGRVDIKYANEEIASIKLPLCSRWTAEELREAATIFNELADALEEKS